MCRRVGLGQLLVVLRFERADRDRGGLPSGCRARTGPTSTRNTWVPDRLPEGDELVDGPCQGSPHRGGPRRTRTGSRPGDGSPALRCASMGGTGSQRRRSPGSMTFELGAARREDRPEAVLDLAHDRVPDQLHRELALGLERRRRGPAVATGAPWYPAVTTGLPTWRTLAAAGGSSTDGYARPGTPTTPPARR